MRLLTNPRLCHFGGAILLCGCVIGNTSTHAGFFSSNFDSGVPPGASLYGSAYVDGTGGVGGTGTLKLTDAQLGQMGSMLIDDLDPGAQITGFTASFKLLIGGGTTADGFSFNFSPFYPDPIIGEEGVNHGLTVSFDTYDNTGGEAPAIDVRFRGRTLYSKKGALDLFRTGDFIDVIVKVDPDATLDLTVNGTVLVADLPAAFGRLPGQFGFGARTGGSTDNHFVDDVTITTTTVPSETPYLFFANPRGAGAPPSGPINAGTLDGAVSKVDPASIVMKVDGAIVPATVFYTNVFSNVSYTPPTPFASGSSHTVSLTFSDTSVPPVTKTVSWDFQVRPYIGPNGNLYEMFYTPWGVTWETANFEAQFRQLLGRQGHLVTITSAEEDGFVELVRRASFPDDAITEVWVGGFQRPDAFNPTNAWFWVNGEGPIPTSSIDPGYSNWLPGEPNDYFGPSSENYLSVGLNGLFGWNDTGNFGSTLLFGYIVEYEALIIPVDVKPGDSSNRIQSNSNGKIPVALLGSATFNVGQVDLATVRAGRTGKEATPVSSSLTDVNGDRIRDLLLHFNTQDLDLACGDTMLTVIARELNGAPLRGADRIDLVNCPPYGLGLVALQDVQGNTELKFKVDTLLPGFRPPTNSGNTQLKSYNLEGKLSWTKYLQNVRLAPDSLTSSTGAVWLAGLKHLQPIQAKMQVPNSKNGQTEILRADARVLFRPDLTLVNVTAPSQVTIRQPFNITAELRELAGDLGGSAVVYLMDGSNYIDVAFVTIEPGGSAGIVFAPRLFEAGQRNLRLVIYASGQDYDPSNNETTFGIEVIRPALEPVFTYLVYNHTDATFLRQEENEFFFRRSFTRYVSENIYQTLYVPGALSFPITLGSFEIAVDGINRLAFESPIDLVFTDIFGCGTNQFGSVYAGDNTYLSAQVYTDCSGFQQTYVSLSRFVYDQLFFSTEFLKQTGELFEYSGQSTVGTPWLPTQNVSTRFTVQDEGGTFGGTATVNSFSNYGFFNEYDITVDGTRVWGYDSQQIYDGYFSGMTNP